MKFPTERHLLEFGGDRFGYEALSKTVLDEVLLKMELPNCFGLYGNWGSGKSTFLNYIKRHLTKENIEYNRTLTVYFEPWKYEQSDQKDLLFALLNCIKEGIGIKKVDWRKLGLGAVAVASGVMGVSVADVSSGLKKLEEEHYKAHEIWIDKVEAFKSDLKETVSKSLKKKKASRLIIFVDDLDRCLPQNAVKLLEAIKNFLSVENTLFVLAIDRRVVSEMIEKKYGLYHGYGEEYLMKIIHYYYELPTVSLQEVIDEVFVSYEIDADDRQKTYIQQTLESEIKVPRVAKHILHQMGMNIVLSKKIKLAVESDTTKTTLLYLFVASLLLSRFPQYFSAGDPRVILRNLHTSTALSTRNEADRKEEYRINQERFPIDLGDRKKLESVMSHPINSKTTSEQSKILDVDQLVRAITLLRQTAW